MKVTSKAVVRKRKAVDLRVAQERYAIVRRLAGVLKHVQEVQRNCYTLAEQLINTGDTKLGMQLVRNAQIHDQSKFSGIEWDNLSVDTDNLAVLALCVRAHQAANPHHPEYWGSVKLMPSVYVAEMVCDWKARSSEFGSSLKIWIDNEATKRFGFAKKDPVYAEIECYVKMLLAEPFLRIV